MIMFVCLLKYILNISLSREIVLPAQSQDTVVWRLIRFRQTAGFAVKLILLIFQKEVQAIIQEDQFLQVYAAA